MRNLALTSFFLLACCVAPGRVSTESERALALSLLSNVDTAVLAAQTLGKITPEQAKFASTQAAIIRDRINASATSPVVWNDLLNEALRIAVEWKVATDTAK